jgi:hypothetical protein
MPASFNPIKTHAQSKFIIQLQRLNSGATTRRLPHNANAIITPGKML